MHPELNLLPRFQITKVVGEDSPSFEGVFDVEIDMRKGWYCYFISCDGKVIEGKCDAYDPVTKNSTFKPEDGQDVSYLKTGETYSYLDSYWGERAALVLDESLEWSRVEFVPQDAVEWRNEHGLRHWAKVGGSSTGELLKGGWDHEHCEICWETISQHDQKHGYVNQHDQWVCEQCYSKKVGPKRISFINDYVATHMPGERK